MALEQDRAYANLRVRLRRMQENLRSGLDGCRIPKTDERKKQMSGLRQLQDRSQAFAVSGQDLEEKLTGCRAENADQG